MSAPQLNFAALFHTAPAALLVLSASPGFPIAAASDAYLAATMTTRDEIVGRELFEVFPDNPADPDATGTRNLRASLERVIATRAADEMRVQRYDIPCRRSIVTEFEERHWAPKNAPVVEDGAPVSLLIHRVDDVTALVKGKPEGSPESWVSARRLLRIDSSQDLSALREAVRALGEECALHESAVTDLLVASSELGSNMLVHAGGGVAEIEAIGMGLPRGVRLRFRDRGPGIADAQKALAGGHSTKRTLGRGLSGSRQLVDQFALDSSKGGTTVTVTKWRREKLG